MPIIKVGDDYADADFGFLGRHLELLDLELIPILAAIKASRDPDSDGLLDAGEYFIGHGFVAIHRYMATVCAAVRTSKFEAVKLGPKLANGSTFAVAINAGANYWKHIEEWFDAEFSGAGLKKNALRTIEQIETITPVADYTCANIMADLRNGEGMELSPLLTLVAGWRDSVFDARVPSSAMAS